MDELEGSTYLGDGLYAKYDDRSEQICLFTSNGINVTNRVYLEGVVLDSFLAFLRGWNSSGWVWIP